VLPRVHFLPEAHHGAEARLLRRLAEAAMGEICRASRRLITGVLAHVPPAIHRNSLPCDVIVHHQHDSDGGDVVY